MKRRTPSRDYPRTARLNSLVQEIVATELERIDDDRLLHVVVTNVVVDGDLARAAVYYDHPGEAEDEEEIQEAFAELRVRLQAAVGKQAQIRRTPELRFESDGVIRDARRIEDVLKGLQGDPEP